MLIGRRATGKQLLQQQNQHSQVAHLQNRLCRLFYIILYGYDGDVPLFSAMQIPISKCLSLSKSGSNNWFTTENCLRCDNSWDYTIYANVCAEWKAIIKKYRRFFFGAKVLKPDKHCHFYRIMGMRIVFNLCGYFPYTFFVVASLYR